MSFRLSNFIRPEIKSAAPKPTALPAEPEPTPEIEAKSGISDPEPWLIELFGAQPSASGIHVAPHKAIRCAPVRAAVATISENIASLPVHVYRRGPDGARERANNHPVERLLSGAVNDFTASSTFRELMTADALLQHGAFAFIGRSSDGRPIEISQLPAQAVTIETDTFAGPTYKVVDDAGNRNVVSRENILHLPSPSLSGKGLVHDGRDIIGLALILEHHASKLFKNGTKLSGILSLKNNMTADAIMKAQTAWQLAHGGDNVGGTAVVPTDVTWQSLVMSSVDAQFLELRAFAIDEVARLFNISPIFLQSLQKATWSNSEQAKEFLLSVTLLPWIRRWEAALTLKLLTQWEREAGFYIEFKTEGFVHADYKARTEGINKLIASRVINPNEARAMLNLPPYEGGDKFINPNVTPGAPDAAG